MKPLAILMGVCFALAGGYGLAHHDDGGIPFLAIGIVLVVIVLWRRT